MRFDKKVYLSSPTMHGEEIKYITEAYESNWMSTVGANLDAIEAGICGYIGTGSAVALSSGTAALHLAIRYAGMKLYGQPEDVAADLHHAVADRSAASDIQLPDMLTRTGLHPSHGMIELKIDAFDYSPIHVGLVMEIAQAHDNALSKGIVVTR